MTDPPPRPPSETVRPVRPLNEEIARKIAAGEVIDRPAAIVRELIDNALDSGAKTITCEIEEGGIKKVRVSDDGAGMTRDDLEQCAKPHATSKISADADLLNISTLGFRGEALASIAAVSMLTITTCRGNAGFVMTDSLSRQKVINPASCMAGTSVQSEELFANMPARRNFLKRPASEAKLCKDIFSEKSIPHTGISMRFIENGKLKLALTSDESLAERFINAFDLPYDARLCYAQSFTPFDMLPDGKPRFSFTVLLGDPAIARNDRKFIHIYTNRRRINEYSLMQAIEYGAEGFFPNGTHPVAALLLEVHPSLIDFNIHPAKREARFKELPQIHHAVSMTVKQFFHEYARKASFSIAHNTQSSAHEFFDKTFSPNAAIAHNGTRSAMPMHQAFQSGFPPNFQSGLQSNLQSKTFFRDSFSHAVSLNAPHESDMQQHIAHNGFVYLGCIFDLYLLAQKDDALYIIDQHAAHEKILYEEFVSHKAETQDLLVPYLVSASSDDEEAYLESLIDALNAAGFRAQKSGATWEFFRVPTLWQGTQDDLRRDLLEKRIAPQDLLKELVASMSCRKAVKDGNIITAPRAIEIIEKVFAMESPRCPHGRPIYYALTKDEISSLVKRT
ncbi:MAG: DNA mismatch repair endonuclease MutL [Treponemataceae bacterium]|nr:MAG: DNA mismatch repair endonuclease MutL [Treponemataceae bacterium]